MIPTQPILHLAARIDDSDGGCLVGRREAHHELTDANRVQILAIPAHLFAEAIDLSETDPLKAAGLFDRLDRARHLRTVAIERAFADLRLRLIAEIEREEPWAELRATIPRRAQAAKAFSGDRERFFDEYEDD